MNFTEAAAGESTVAWLPDNRAVHVFAPLPFWGRGPMETCYNICSQWPAAGVRVAIHTAASHRDDPGGVLSPLLPKWLPDRIKGGLLGSPARFRRLMSAAESRGLRQVRPGDLCYVWPGASNAAVAAARDRGGIILLEFINTHVRFARALLDAECDRIGAPPCTDITEDRIAEEDARLGLADLVFAPGPFVGPSIRAQGPPRVRILETSYGTHLPRRPRPPRAPGPLRFVFAGSIGIRKGVHVLLEAWRRAALPAELVLAGGVEPWMAAHAAKDSPASVRFAGYQTDMTALYEGADVFVFPSLEEGGPQVAYEAAAFGLPQIVTEMGGGRIARHGHNALVVPPADADALAAAMTRMFTDEGLRLRLGYQGAQDALAYTWPAVAAQRLRLLAGTAAPDRPPA